MKVRWLGRVPYREAWDLQRALSARSDEDYLLLLEHPPVYTIGRSGDPDHVLCDPAAVGAELVHVDRGGDVTYHGPGQLVGYPLLTIGSGMERGVGHVHLVEQMVIDALLALGSPPGSVGRLEGFPGVWIGPDGGSTESGTGPRKVCAVGVRTSKGRTTHGFALNVTTDLAMFKHIVPCGIVGFGVTSLEAEGIPATIPEVLDAVIASADATWGPIEDVQRVTDAGSRRDSPATSSSRSSRVHPLPEPRGTNDPKPVAVAFGDTRGERSLDRRLRRAGIEPAGGLGTTARKPTWMRVPARMESGFLDLRQELRRNDLVTVCEEAGCPNIYECWADGTATFMINGSRCTRACGFCQVDTRRPLALDTSEPARLAETVQRMGLAHAVVTCVARDDLSDGGAGAFAATIAAIRQRSPSTVVEVLISDCKGERVALRTIFDASPDVLNHNLETVARLQRAVRPSAGYARSLAVLARAKDAGLTTKSGLIVGMGEQMDEVLSALADLRAVGVDIVTVGQYLRPSTRHLPVSRWWTPDEFDVITRAAASMGFAHVQASPLTRSSYHAREAAAASCLASGSGLQPAALV